VESHRGSVAREPDLSDSPAGDQRVIAQIRIGTTHVTTRVLTARGRIAAIRIDFQQVT
jgi:hypothetical protein